jgi:hypothetical protein
MQRYLSTVWAMLSPFTGEVSPLLERLEGLQGLEELEALETLDLEAHGEGGADSIVLVCEVPEEHVRVSPFSEDHAPVWARLGTGSV